MANGCGVGIFIKPAERGTKNQILLAITAQVFTLVLLVKFFTSS
jgi:hypothetical protein